MPDNYIRPVENGGETRLIVICPHCERHISIGEDDGYCALCFKEIEQLNIAAWTEYAPIGRELNRAAFEADAGPYGFDLTRTPGGQLTVEPWAEYVDQATGHRWAGWLARTGDA